MSNTTARLMYVPASEKVLSLNLERPQGSDITLVKNSYYGAKEYNDESISFAKESIIITLESKHVFKVEALGLPLGVEVFQYSYMEKPYFVTTVIFRRIPPSFSEFRLMARGDTGLYSALEMELGTEHYRYLR